MSVENRKVCCNCRHNVGDRGADNKIYCWCNIEERYLSYVEVIIGWCRHWAKERKDKE